MFITHHFSHQETLNRARYWLTRFGFDAGRMEVSTEGTPRISLRAEPSEVAEAELLFAALELADPYGAPGFWDSGLAVRHITSTADVALPEVHAATAVGWHPPDVDLSSDPVVRALFEMMDH